MVGRRKHEVMVNEVAITSHGLSLAGGKGEAFCVQPRVVLNNSSGFGGSNVCHVSTQANSSRTPS